ncbi:MAG: GlcG, partial [Sphingomonas bacterium]|nr:GlcG [Sphingomonas bacterium]
IVAMTSRSSWELLLGWAMLSTQPAQAGQAPLGLPISFGLNAAAALQMAQAAVSMCEARGYPVVAIITSAEGMTRIQYMSDGAHPIDIESARRKAATAARTGRATSALAAAAKANGAFASILTTLMPDSLPVGGGLPILRDMRIVGAIGVGGAPGADLDEDCARVGVARMPGLTPGP